MAYRIMIIGSSCSGKTTLGRKLGAEIGLKHIDLDDLNWLPNWQESKHEDLRQKIKDEIHNVENWVITGGYSRTWDITMPRATHVIFPDLSYPVLLWRLLVRTFRRVVKKEKCCGDNVETLSNFLSKDSLLIWQVKSFKKKKENYETLKASPHNPNTKFLRFKRIGDVQTVIDAL